MIDELKISVAFTGDELYETIKLYDILRDMDFELSETQVQAVSYTHLTLPTIQPV